VDYLRCLVGGGSSIDTFGVGVLAGGVSESEFAHGTLSSVIASTSRSFHRRENESSVRLLQLRAEKWRLLPLEASSIDMLPSSMSDFTP